VTCLLSLTRSLTHSLTHSLTLCLPTVLLLYSYITPLTGSLPVPSYSLTHSLTRPPPSLHSPTHSLTHSLIMDLDPTLLSALIALLLILLTLLLTHSSSSSSSSSTDVSVALQQEEAATPSLTHSHTSSDTRVLHPVTFKPFLLTAVTQTSHNTKLLRFEIPEGRSIGLPIGKHISVMVMIDGNKGTVSV
jgi:hypothetical protein